MHRLKGTGGAYGVPDVTAEAYRAEQVIDRLMAARDGAGAELNELRTHISGVADAFERARSTE